MKANKQQSVMIGAFLIALGLVWWLNLWYLIWPGALAIAGVIAYRQRRSMGRPVEAVQAALWCIGLALLFLLHFVWPGVLFLAGVSILVRGRELQLDDRVQRMVAQARSRRSAAPQPITTQHVPITSQQMPATNQHLPAPTTPQFGLPASPTTDETTRLHE